MQRFHIGTQSICSSSYPSCPGRSWRSCRSKSCRAASSTSSRPSPAQLSPLSLCSASMTSSPSARTTPATASLWRCRLPLTTCYSRFVPCLIKPAPTHSLKPHEKMLKQKHSTQCLPQSDVPIDLLDVDKNSAVVSFSECDAEVSKCLSNELKKLAPVPLKHDFHVFLFSSPMGTSSWPHTDVRLTQPDLSSR